MALFLVPKLGLLTFDDNSIFSLAYSFCGGMLVGYFYINNSSLKINQGLGIISLVTLFTLVTSIKHSYFILPEIPVASDKSNWYAAIAVACVFIILFTKLSINKKVKSFLGHYGAISYSTYLYHNLFIAIAILVIIQFDINDGNLKLVITFIFTLISSYVVAGVSYKYIEKPSILLGRMFITKQH